jgi:hypothetical protein
MSEKFNKTVINRLSLICLISLVFFISACTLEKDCAVNNAKSCDRSCDVDSDCYASCGCACLNKDQDCKGDEIIECQEMECVCKDSQCVLAEDYEEEIAKFKESSFNIIEFWGIECWGCGGNFFITGEVLTDGTVKEYNNEKHLIFSKAGIAFECLDRLNSSEYGAKLTNQQTDELKVCIKELEEQSYCRDEADCPCEMDMYNCEYVCSDGKCEYINEIE